MYFCKEIILISSHFSWQMARVVGGALHVRMFPHMFLIPTLVSVVSFFFLTYTHVICFHSVHCTLFPSTGEAVCWVCFRNDQRDCRATASVRHHMHVVCTQLELQAFVFLADCSGDRPSHHAHQVSFVFSLDQSWSDGRSGCRLLLTSNCNSLWNSDFNNMSEE